MPWCMSSSGGLNKSSSFIRCADLLLAEVRLLSPSFSNSSCCPRRGLNTVNFTRNIKSSIIKRTLFCCLVP